MRKFLFCSRTPVLAASLALGALAGCHKERAAPDERCATPATVRDLTGFDGCGKVLELANGQRLEPSGAAWRNFVSTDGQRIVVGYTPVSGASICMVGQTVEITCIRTEN